VSEIVHVHKAAGVSGSEAHLLSVLPQLRRRGWDVRMLVLHGREPGAADFIGRLEDVPVEELRIRSHVDPRVFTRLVRRFRGVAAVHAHLVHAHVHALPAALAARVPVRIAHYHGFSDYPGHRRFIAAERDPAVVRAFGAAGRRWALDVFPESRPVRELDAIYRRLHLVAGAKPARAAS